MFEDGCFLQLVLYAKGADQRSRVKLNHPDGKAGKPKKDEVFQSGALIFTHKGRVSMKEYFSLERA
jgi:hypothetical protein